MKITWVGHACFKVEEDCYAVIFDPYNDGSVPGLEPVREEANEVYCSHQHGDHNAVGCVSLKEADASKCSVTTIETYHDDKKGSMRGPNTIHIMEMGGKKIVHFGDLGCDLTEEEKGLLQDIDLAMIPVGGFFTIDGAQAAAIVKELQPKAVIPMHFRDDEKGFGYDMIGTVDTFASCFDDVTVTGTSTIDVDDACKGIMVLTPATLA